MQTFYYIKFRDPGNRQELFKIGICSTSVAERWGRQNGSQFEEIESLLAEGRKLKKHNTPMEVLLIDSWSFPSPLTGESSKAIEFEQWVKEKFKPYQAKHDVRWSRLKEFVRTGMSELFSQDLYECKDVTIFDDVRSLIHKQASAMGGILTSEKEAQRLQAYIGKERLARKS